MAKDDDFALVGQLQIGATMRAVGILAVLLSCTLLLMPVQWVLLKFFPTRARTFPHWYHRCVCRLLGIRLHVDGQVARNRPVLIIANHVSWLDITVLSAVAPVSFIAKSEVGRWPFVSWLAKLQRTVFVNRQRRTDVGKVAKAMTERLAAGDILILFAEGTSTDGNRVLPFRSALISSAFSKGGKDVQTMQELPAPAIQTLSLAYTHLHGIPLGRDDRKLIAWYGNMEMATHAWELLKAGPLDVHIFISEPMAFDRYQDRKKLARSAEQKVRSGVTRMLRNNTD